VVAPFEFGGNAKSDFDGDLIPGVCGGVIILELPSEEMIACPCPEVRFNEPLREDGTEEDDLLDVIATAFSVLILVPFPLYANVDDECFDIGEAGIDWEVTESSGETCGELVSL